MPKQLFVAICLMAISSMVCTAASVAEKPAPEDSITVTVVGTLRTGIVAIGGETTGTTITAKGITWELDFGKSAKFRKVAEKLNGNKVVMQGSLERRRGVEIKERWIVTVTGLKGHEEDGKAVSGVGAVEKPAEVRVKVVYGTADEKQQRVDIDLWISQAVAKTGSPIALPYTGWVALTDKNQRLHSANGLYIDGTSTVRNGKYEIEIEGCSGFSLDQNVTLKPGERRVVNLSGIPGPDNFFVALEAPGAEAKTE